MPRMPNLFLERLRRPVAVCIGALAVCTAAALAACQLPVPSPGADRVQGTAERPDNAVEDTVRHPFIDVSAGMQHTCAIRADGAATCWPDTAGVDPPAGEKFTAVTSGSDYSCGLRADGTAVCWGAGSDLTGLPSPVPDDQFRALSAGESHPCGVRTDGTLSCWSGAREPGPLYVPPGERFVAVSMGTYHGENSCGTNESAVLLCWSNRLPARGTPWVAIEDAGAVSDHNGHRHVWTDDFGKSYVHEEEPVVNLGQGFIAVSTGSDDVCALRQSGDVTCWKFGSSGSTVHDLEQYHPLLPDQKLSELGHGAAHFRNTHQRADYRCGIDRDGSALCWFPDPKTQEIRVTKIPSEDRFVKIGSGFRHTCGLLADGSIRCWGDNFRSRIMPPSTDAMPTPVPTNLGDCTAGKRVPMGSGCQRRWSAEETAFAVTDQGEAILYKRGQIAQTQFGAMYDGHRTHSHHVADGGRTIINHHLFVGVLAYANSDGGWTLDMVNEWLE